MQSIRMQDEELVTILENQLDEYLVKPIPREKLENVVATLIHHIRQTSRRQESLVHVDDLCQWDKENQALFYKDKEINLTNKERELLVVLFSNINQAITYNTICMALWGENVDIMKQERIKTLIKQLRKKLPHNIIKNIFAFGYKIEI